MYKYPDGIERMALPRTIEEAGVVRYTARMSEATLSALGYKRIVDVTACPEGMQRTATFNDTDTGLRIERVYDLEITPPAPRLISGNDLVRRIAAVNPAAIVEIKGSQVPDIIIGAELVRTAREGIDLDAAETRFYFAALVEAEILTEAAVEAILA